MGFVTAFLIFFAVGAVVSFLLGFAFADSLKEQFLVSIAAGTILACAMCGIGWMMTRIVNEQRAEEVGAGGYGALRTWIGTYPGEKPMVRRAMADGRITKGEYEILEKRFIALEAADQKTELAKEVRTAR